MIVCEPRGKRAGATASGKSVIAPTAYSIAPLRAEISAIHCSAFCFRVHTTLTLCAGNHGLRIECAHHRAIDRWSPRHVNGGLRLAIRARPRGRANKNDNRIHDRSRFFDVFRPVGICECLRLSAHSLSCDELQHGVVAKARAGI
jgi:hypothetical protein